MMKRWMLAGFLFLAVGCAGSVELTEDQISAALPEARKINNQYRVGCLSMGWPEGSMSYINCLLNFYQGENPTAADRHDVLTEALKRVSGGQ